MSIKFITVYDECESIGYINHTRLKFLTINEPTLSIRGMDVDGNTWQLSEDMDTMDEAAEALRDLIKQMED